MVYKYAVEIRRRVKGWSRGAIWAVKPGDFREFLGYINNLFIKAGAVTRIRRIQGDPPAKLTWPEDKLGC